MAINKIFDKLNMFGGNAEGKMIELKSTYVCEVFIERLFKECIQMRECIAKNRQSCILFRCFRVAEQFLHEIIKSMQTSTKNTSIIIIG